MKNREKRIKNRFITFYNKLVEGTRYKNSSFSYVVFWVFAVIISSIATYFLSEKLTDSVSKSERNIYIFAVIVIWLVISWLSYFSIFMFLLVRKLYGEKSCRLYFSLYKKYRKLILLDFRKYEYEVLFSEELEDAKNHPNQYNKIYL